MIISLAAVVHKHLLRHRRKGGRGGSGLGEPISAAVRAATQSPEGTLPQDSADLLEFICASPILSSCGLSREQVQAGLGVWVELGDLVTANLRLPPRRQLSLAQKRRIFQYYLPVFFWCQSQLLQHRDVGSDPGPLVLGISAPQGCGKTTLCEQLEALFKATGCAATSISIDDFYHTYWDQQAVAAAHPNNPLLQMRGNAGSHDMQLGTDTLRALRNATSSAISVPIPRYDKSAHSGKGDRADPSRWPSASGPLDVVLFEGWMLGFAPVEDAWAAAADPHLAPVNAFLRSYKEAWDSFVDAWLVVRVSQPDYAYRWRLQAEQAMRASGRPSMTDEQVAACVDRFMPAYRCYLPGLYERGPTTARAGHLLVVEVDEGRDPVAAQPDPIM